MAPGEALRIEVVYCPAPRQVDIAALSLPPGSTVADAVAKSGMAHRHPEAAAAWRLAVWGRSCESTQPLRDRDRVELLRPLTVDPKEARRLRYKGRRPIRVLSGSRTR